MDEIITYSLRNGQKRSDQYSRDITNFTRIVLVEVGQQVGQVIDDYQGYIQQQALETLRSFEEYAFEFLMLGTFWRVYAQRALELTTLPQKTLSSLGKWRKRYRPLKPAIDWLRGVLGSAYLTSRNGKSSQIPEPTLNHMQRLLEWMAATGELNEEVKRLQLWLTYLTDLAPSVKIEVLTTAIQLADWFEDRSLDALGKYTPNVEQFLAKKHPNYRWREDVIMCGRQRVEYHLNMVGTEILNSAFREAFLRTERKIVLLPPCMKAKPEDECKAQDTPFGQRCAACTPGCRIHQTTKLGEKHGFAVFVMPHELSVFSSGEIQPTSDDNVGIVGVSCPLTNVTGGWETKDLGVPAQGVLLDYCGCSWHWHEEGVPTDINFRQLLAVMDVKARETA